MAAGDDLMFHVYWIRLLNYLINFPFIFFQLYLYLFGVFSYCFATGCFVILLMQKKILWLLIMLCFILRWITETIHHTSNLLLPYIEQ